MTKLKPTDIVQVGDRYYWSNKQGEGELHLTFDSSCWSIGKTVAVAIRHLHDKDTRKARISRSK